MMLEYLQKPNYIPNVYMPFAKSGNTWEVNEDITVTLSNDFTIMIPKGFKNDLSSVPKRLWSFFPPFNRGLFASLLHDYLYHVHYGIVDFEWSSKKARKFADDEFLRWMRAHDTSKFDSKVRYYAVRIFGGLVYNGLIKI